MTIEYDENPDLVLARVKEHFEAIKTPENVTNGVIGAMRIFLSDDKEKDLVLSGFSLITELLSGLVKIEEIQPLVMPLVFRIPPVEAIVAITGLFFYLAEKSRIEGIKFPEGSVCPLKPVGKPDIPEDY